LFPIAYPISWLLDKVLGSEHGSRYRRAELQALVGLHIAEQHNKNTFHTNKEGLSTDEVTIIQGALQITNFKVKDCLIPLDTVFMLSTDNVLDEECMLKIHYAGHSRIPIYDGHPHNIRGLLLAKNLIVVEQSAKRTVGSLHCRPPTLCTPDTSLLDLLNMFQTGQSHLALVCDRPDIVRKAYKEKKLIPPNVHMSGVITIEDITEKLIQEDILDERDKKLEISKHIDTVDKKRRRRLKLKDLVVQERKKIDLESAYMKLPASDSVDKNPGNAGNDGNDDDDSKQRRSSVKAASMFMAARRQKTTDGSSSHDYKQQDNAVDPYAVGSDGANVKVVIDDSSLNSPLLTAQDKKYGSLS